MGHNISEPPLPDIGAKAALWDEFCTTKVDLLARVPAESIRTAEGWLATLPRPVVFLHTKARPADGPPRLVPVFSRGYHARKEGVMITLTKEQARLLAETVESPPRVVDPLTQHIYFLVKPDPTGVHE
jgi:hypothetical protein